MKPAKHMESQSLSPVDGTRSADAPTSVMCLPASLLSRELSDLSGSYMNGNTAPRGRHGCNNSSRCGIPLSICSNTEASVQGPWHQAHILSSPAPRQTSWQTSIVVERNGIIELVKENESHNEDGRGEYCNDNQQQVPSGAISQEYLPTSPQNSNRRIPLMILLMDPGRKQFELMQLWVDTEIDIVRDILHAVQQNLSDKWRTDYDGLFQARGDQYIQLVHILSIAKYDVHPHELWVAKPWSMAAKTTTETAKDCIQQLRAGGLLTFHAGQTPKRRINFLAGRAAHVPGEDAPLTLSEEALKRLYLPNPTLKHHHACQFLTFRISKDSSVEPSAVRQNHHYQYYQHPKPSGFLGLGSLLGTNSFDDTSSQLSSPSDVLLLPPNADDKLNPNSDSGVATPRRNCTHQQGNQPRKQYSGNIKREQPNRCLTTAREASAPDQDRATWDPNATHVSKPLKDKKFSIQKNLKKKRQLLFQFCSTMNCLAGRARGRGSEKNSVEGFSSSWGGDGSSSGMKIRNDSTGRISPSETSKGSVEAEESDDMFFVETSADLDGGGIEWQAGNRWARFGDDPSVVSASAPLLSNLLRSSSSSVGTYKFDPSRERN